jgi:four helix bundle protein
MAFQVEEYAFEVIVMAQPLIQRIQRRDKSLADQLSRASSSVALNIAEGNGSDPGNRRARFFTASGSAKETRAALRVGVLRRYFVADEAAAASKLLDRIIAILWSLTRR